MQSLKVSISYSWDNDEKHKQWVRKLADYLEAECGIDVTLDQYDLTAGKNMQLFMETAIEKADKVLLILTPGYKAKADSRTAGVGFEHSIISASLFETQSNNTKFIPVLRKGSSKESSPVYIKSMMYHDMTKDDRFESDAFELARLLYDEPAINKPIKGEKPDFTKIPDPILEQAKNLAITIEKSNKRNAYVKSYEAMKHVADELRQLFMSIKSKAEEYKSIPGLFIQSDCNEHRLILNINGIGMNLFYHLNDQHGYERNELLVTIWSKPLLIGNSQFYFPSDEPKQLWKTIFKPIFNDELELMWQDRNNIFTTEGLNGYCYSTLFEFVRTKQTK